MVTCDLQACREHGLLVLTAGAGDVIRILPPLVCTDQYVSCSLQYFSLWGFALDALCMHFIHKPTWLVIKRNRLSQHKV